MIWAEIYFLQRFCLLPAADAQVIVPSDSNYLGNPKSCIAVRVKSKTAYSRVRIEVAETPFFSRSVSEFVLNKPRTEYTIYPDIIWNYEALKNEVQAEPVSVAITVEMNGKDLGQRVRTFSVRSINECLLGYVRMEPNSMIQVFSLLPMSMKRIR